MCVILFIWFVEFADCFVARCRCWMSFVENRDYRYVSRSMFSCGSSSLNIVHIFIWAFAVSFFSHHYFLLFLLFVKISLTNENSKRHMTKQLLTWFRKQFHFYRFRLKFVILMVQIVYYLKMKFIKFCDDKNYLLIE